MFHLHAHHFNLSFVALGYNYVPTEELLDKEEEESAAIADEETEMGWVSLESSDGQDAEPIDGKENLQHFLSSVRCLSRRSSTSGVLIWATKTPQ